MVVVAVRMLIVAVAVLGNSSNRRCRRLDDCHGSDTVAYHIQGITALR